MGGSGGIALPFLTQQYIEVSGQLHVPAALPLGNSPPPVPIGIGGWMDPRVNPDAAEGRKMFPFRESNVDRPANSSSLYWLRIFQ
jgi:hypothetical protein